MAKNLYQICKKTIMDTTDSQIKFDDQGISDYYYNFKEHIYPNWKVKKNGEEELMKLADKIKRENKGKDFDCILGISGGLDSSYTAYILKEKMGLRPLLIHVDAGWNTQQAVANVEKIVDGLGLDLYTEVINWEEMKDVQRAFFYSQIPEQDIPQDYVFFSSLYQFANKNKIKFVVTGSNISTECIREPEEWGAYPGIDTLLFKDIHKKFGKKKLLTFPLVDIFTYKIFYRYFKGMQIIKPLDYISYVKKDAEELLAKKYGWEKFQHKHHESRFTRFCEDFWLPRKFGFDKRKAHFSSLILTDQMTREEALERIKTPEMPEDFLLNEFNYIAKKLDFTTEEFWDIFHGKNRTFQEYKNKKFLMDLGKKFLTFINIENRLFR